MRTPKVVLDRKENFVTMARNAARGENHMFRNLFASVDGTHTDIVDGGALACSFFLSAVLYINKLIGDMHANMAGVERDLAASGWHEVAGEPAEGDVVVWEPRTPSKERAFDPTRLHAGIYVGAGRAVSNGSNTTHMPEEHEWTFGNTRKALRVWRYPGFGA